MNDYDNIWLHRAKWTYLLLIVITLMSPVFYVMYISFNANGFGAATYTFTWKWYGLIFSDQLLMQALRWTMSLAIMTMIVTVPFALLAAKLYKESNFKPLIVFLDDDVYLDEGYFDKVREQFPETAAARLALREDAS